MPHRGLLLQHSTPTPIGGSSAGPLAGNKLPYGGAEILLRTVLYYATASFRAGSPVPLVQWIGRIMRARDRARKNKAKPNRSRIAIRNRNQQHPVFVSLAKSRECTQ